MFNNATFACKTVVKGKGLFNFDMGMLAALSLLLKGFAVAFLLIE